MAVEHRSAAGRRRTGSRVKRVALAAAMSVASINLWTGGPLLALWVGSHAQGDGPPTMTAIFVVIMVLGVVTLGLTWLLGRLGAAYDREAGRTAVRRHVPWLRSMRGEREAYKGERGSISALERTLVIAVVVAVAAFEVWFFFFSASPIDQRSGRGQVPGPPSPAVRA
jgi:hypothetical protein